MSLNESAETNSEYSLQAPSTDSVFQAASRKSRANADL
jgi:hypothetical protein